MISFLVLWFFDTINIHNIKYKKKYYRHITRETCTVKKLKNTEEAIYYKSAPL